MGGTLVECLRINHFLRWRILFKSEDFGRSWGSYLSYTNNLFLINSYVNEPKCKQWHLHNGRLHGQIKMLFQGTRHKILSG